ncbi:hypothetical protein Nepgr_010559 [Nepenthes gracilis]|uniref:SBP-type domain-containing protein n=1 Tax=Nepenthes gracilis TaxID=150966 RepID=A0AAD3SDL1_NEPGR|nr:hypothetical protein Nepgr_010559 [Nepenthes gracilis]
MEAKFGGKAHHVYGPVMADMKAEGKRSLEWDLNDWKWDSDLFVASQLNPAPSDCRSRQFFPVRPEIPLNTHISNCSPSSSDEVNLIDDRGKRELEKRRRAVVVLDEEINDEAASLNLKLGGQVYPIAEGEADKWEGKSGKKTKLVVATRNYPVCQVEDCRADLSNAKDYHRRHKVCDMHSKATKALVGNVMQRFCQQCSRFHVLQEFDEGKRSCRRRLAGHNRRRRKTHPETAINMGSMNDESSSSYLLISLLRILTNLHSSSTDQTKGQDLLSHLLRNLSSLAGALNESNISGLGQRSQGLQDVEASAGAKDPLMADQQCETASAQKQPSTNESPSGMQQTASAMHPRVQVAGDFVPSKENGITTMEKRHQLTNIDLNNEYNDTQDCVDKQEKPSTSLDCPIWVRDSLKSSPPQTSGNSDSISAHSLSSSSGSEPQSRTDRIVFKLFGKDPSDLPQLLRLQLLQWLSRSPTDIEGYIRPGCIVLSIYLRLNKSLWEELCCNLGSSLIRLLDVSNDPFWRTGWIYTRVRNRVAFICNGQVVLDTPFPSKSYKNRISSISPVAVAASERVQFVIKGPNLSQSTSRLFCTLEGKYLLQESCNSLVEGNDASVEHGEIQCLCFPCSIPNVTGRGYIEVEDFGLSGSFFPFIVAEPDVCSEICTLERVIDVEETADDIQGGYEKIEERNQALDFLHEMGWLLHRNRRRFRPSDTDCLLELFPFERIKCLLDFSMDRDWCAVVVKLLDILFNGTVDAGGHPSVEHALSGMDLLHRAVRRNCRPMVESLLRYVPERIVHKLDCLQAQQNQENQGLSKGFLFRPDTVGPGGLTPLHIAASRDGFENVLDALMEDPGMVGIKAWKSMHDSTGLTPNDYACLRGHYSYIHLVQRKINEKSSRGHVVVDIPPALSDKISWQKQPDKLEPAKVASFQTDKMGAKSMPQSCNQCNRKLHYGYARTALTYRPAMLSLVTIAAVCVCVALLFKSSPRVYIFKPFCWESLKYGSI